MNNLNPLIPQGSNLEQNIKGRSRVKLAVFVVLAAHVLFLGPLLMQGCKREQPTAPTAETNAQPPLDTLTNELAQLTNNLVPQPVETPIPTVPAPTATEYTVIAGDNFYDLGKKFGVSMKAIAAANPGVDPAKLKIGQKLMIPPPTAAPPKADNGAAVPATDGETPYIVKSGDTLSRIADAHHTTVKAIRAANNLTTDKIKVGQTLKIPKSTAPAPAPGQTTPAPPTAPPSN